MGDILDVKYYPYYFKAIELDRVIDAVDAVNDPRTSEYYETYLKPLDITSMLDAPIRKGGLMIGIVCFEQGGRQRTWTIDEQLFGGAIADSISLLMESAEKMAAEKALLEKEQLLSSVYDTVGDSIFVLSTEKDGRFKFVSINKTFETTTGFTAKQIVGKYLEEIKPSPSLIIALDNYKKAMLNKKIVRWEGASDFPMGSLIGEVSVATQFDEKGNSTLLVGAIHDITDRKKNEEALKNKTNQLNLAQQLAHIGSWEWDVLGNKIEWSDELYRIFGIKPQEFEPSYENYLKNIHPDDREYVNDIIQQAGRDLKPFAFYHKIIQPNGNVRIIHSFGSVLINSSGNTTTMSGTAQDVTDQKNAEDKIIQLSKQLEELLKERTAALTKTQASLQDSEMKYSKIVEEAGDLVYSSDCNGYFTYVNPISKKITGYTENELIGKHFLDFIDPEWKEKVAKFYKEQFDNKNADTIFSFPIITKSGEKKWVEQVVVQQKDGDRITGHHAIVRDITERIKAEKALIESEEKFSKAFQFSPIGLVLANVDTHNFTDVNESFLKIIGFGREEVVGHNSDELFLIKPDVRKEIQEALKQKGWIKDKEIKIRKKTGDLTTVLFSTVLLYIKGVKSTLTIINDISKQKIAEIEIKQKSEELVRSNEELEQFAYVASHDLQEPLRTISNFVGLLDKIYLEKADEDTKQYFKFIVGATSKMQDLIKDLLDYSRVGRNLTFTNVDCSIIFKEVIVAMDASIKESNAKITSTILPVLKGNENELRRLFQNLLSNAIKFRKKNTVPEITFTVEQKEKEYLFAIKDNGIGIEEQHINKLFIIFQRLHADTEYPGTGIGLATCKKIVALHGGKIWAESKLGVGSTFYFTLPKEKNN